MGIPRNAPCPCGSGKKHKHCCLGKVDRRTKRRLILTVSFAALAVCGGAVALGTSTSIANGIVAAIAGASGIGIFLAVRSPPRSRGRAGADRIDFGR